MTACTEFVAETLLPTTSGHYRLRGYRHTIEFVSALEDLCDAVKRLQGCEESTDLLLYYLCKTARQIIQLWQKQTIS